MQSQKRKEYMKQWRTNHPNNNINYRHSTGRCKSMYENKQCSAYLGITIAEKALSRIFKHIKRMPYGNPGYDFECDKGYLIDVKSACLHLLKNGSFRWTFKVDENTKADYFLFLLFNNREELKPMYVLLIPGSLINNKQCIGITNTPKSLAKWAEYMQPLDKVEECCGKMRNINVNERN